MFIVAREELDEHGVVASGVVAFHDFRNLHQFGCRFLVHRAAFERDAHISAGAVANVFGVDRIARASDDTGFTQARNALMDGCAADTAYFCHVFEGYAGVKRDYLKYLQIQFINFLHVLFF